MLSSAQSVILDDLFDYLFIFCWIEPILKINLFIGDGGVVVESKAIGAGPAFQSMKLQKNEKPLEPTKVELEKKTVSEKIEEKVEKAQESKHSHEFLTQQVEGMNKFLDASYTSLKYNVHEKLERLYVQVIDKESEEVIREVPSEEFLDMIASMLQHMGLIIDKRI